MRLVTGNVIPQSEIADAIVKPFMTALSSTLLLAEKADELSPN